MSDSTAPGRSDMPVRCILLLCLTACLRLTVAAQQPVTLILYNGKIWTENPRQKEAEAVALSGGHIAWVGSTAAILKLEQPGTQSIDLEGRRVLPGFNDAHVHFYSGGAGLAGPQLRYSKSQREFRETLAEFVRQQPVGALDRRGQLGSRELDTSGAPNPRADRSGYEK